IFRRNTRDLTFVRSAEDAKTQESNFVPVLLAGVALGAAVALIKNFIPQKIDAAAAASGTTALTFSGPVVVSMLLAIAAIVAWPMSKAVDRMGTKQGLVYGLVGTFLSLSAISLASNSYVLMIMAFVTAPFFSLASVSAFPYALGKLSVRSVTLGTGIFFGSVELADGMMNILEKM
ncbi:MAG TPA: hypothetical protein VEB86_15565, partial [Chryseosolibacter sp.]|nr:hypothetical protein [Chryseosolibacter sp.]